MNVCTCLSRCTSYSIGEQKRKKKNIEEHIQLVRLIKYYQLDTAVPLCREELEDLLQHVVELFFVQRDPG